MHQPPSETTCFQCNNLTDTKTVMHASLMNPALHTVFTDTGCNTLLFRQEFEEGGQSQLIMYLSVLSTVPPGLPSVPVA